MTVESNLRLLWFSITTSIDLMHDDVTHPKGSISNPGWWPVVLVVGGIVKVSSI